jgi:hypothetical protein
MRRRLIKLLSGSAAIAILVGIFGSVYANNISAALGQRHPDYVYVGAAVLLILFLIACLAIYALLRELTERDRVIAVAPAESLSIPDQHNHVVTLGTVAADAARQVDFCGIIARRSVGDDAFRRTIERRRYDSLQLRFLLLDPACPSFSERAREEGESVVSWASSLESTVEHLRNYRRELDLDVTVRLTDFYPVWRLILVDESLVHVHNFLPGKRGTEALQYSLSNATTPEFVYGFRRYFAMLWASASEVPL